jgi:hypothetical protein
VRWDKSSLVRRAACGSVGEFLVVTKFEEVLVLDVGFFRGVSNGDAQDDLMLQERAPGRRSHGPVSDDASLWLTLSRYIVAYGDLAL